MRFYEEEKYNLWLEKSQPFVVEIMKKNILKVIPIDEDKCKLNIQMKIIIFIK